MTTQSLNADTIYESISNLKVAATKNADKSDRVRLLGKRLGKIIDAECDFIFIVITDLKLKFPNKAVIKEAALRLSGIPGVHLFSYLLETLCDIIKNNQQKINESLQQIKDLETKVENLKQQIDSLSKEKSELEELCASMKNNRIGDFDFQNVIEKVLAITNNKDFRIIDMFKAVQESTGDECILIIYDGLALHKSINIDGINVELKHRLNPNFLEDVRNWNECYNLQDGGQWLGAFCHFFLQSTDCLDIITNHSLVTAVFPAVRKKEISTLLPHPKDNFELVIKVVVKAIGFKLLDEQYLPMEVRYEDQSVPIVIVAGYSEFCVKSGCAVGLSNGALGFGTIGGIVRKKQSPTEVYAVTCKHVTDKLLMDFQYSGNHTFNISCPPPAHRKYLLLRNLGYEVYNAEGGFLRNLDTLFLRAILDSDSCEVKSFMCGICKSQLPLSSGDDVSKSDIKIFLGFDCQQICNSNDIEYLTERQINYGNDIIAISGDIALMPLQGTAQQQSFSPMTCSILDWNQLRDAWNNNREVEVKRKGAATTKVGKMVRPGHIRDDGCLISQFYSNRQSEQGTVYKNQILINGKNFGCKGDSGSLVATPNKELVGIFTGSLDSNLFWATPIEYLDTNIYEWVE